MKLTRRTALAMMVATFGQGVMPRAAFARGQKVRHILPTATARAFGVCVSLAKPCKQLDLKVGALRVAGTQTDSKGRFWTFEASGLVPDTQYELQLFDGPRSVDEPWPLRTFPAADASPQSMRLLAYTCAGGADGFGLPGRQFFKPHEFRQKLFDEALAQKPHAGIAIGDHIYWDLHGGAMPVLGRRSRLIKVLAGWYLKFFYGAFDRSLGLIGTKNEKVLTTIGDEQIADLYGTRFRSLPMFFMTDDHDYFENDDADENLVTFPPDDFSMAAYKAMADLYYPKLPGGPDQARARAFGLLRFGDLFEAPMFDCAGHLSLDGAHTGLVPPHIEDWLKQRAEKSDARHFAFVPSHPMGWTAGKWREWYPDVVAPEGFTGVVTNVVMGGDIKGRLTTKAQKYLWPQAWWDQHQRLLGALGNRPTSRYLLSGDIHALGAVEITKSGSLSLDDKPVCSILAGPVGTSDATWPSAARGITAARPDWLTTNDLVATKEVNGFTILDLSREAARVTLFDCGGYDRDLKEDGRVRGVYEFEIG